MSVSFCFVQSVVWEKVQLTTILVYFSTKAKERYEFRICIVGHRRILTPPLTVPDIPSHTMPVHLWHNTFLYLTPPPHPFQPAQAQEEMTDEKLASLPPELLIKHPLQNPWTLWYYENDKSRTWEQNQVEIITVSSVEDFWS